MMRNSMLARGLATTLLAFAGASATAQDSATETALLGPAFGTNRYQASIESSTSEPDIDDYVAPLLAGERLTVTLTAPRSSPLIPRLALVGPDGAVIVPTQIVSKSGGKSLTLKDFVVPTTGRWAVRVSGAQGTEGAYTATFKTAAAKPVRRNAVAVTAPGSTAVSFDGLNGASLDVTLTWKAGAGPVTLGSVESPGHIAIPGASPRVARTSVVLRNFELKGADGAYTLRLSSTGAAAACVVTVRVTPQSRPSSKKTVSLSGTEPWLAPQDAPILGVPGTPVRLTGGNFSTDDPPRVFFGRELAISYVVADGTGLDVIPPVFVDGATVAVAVVAKDGQAVCRNDCFHYVEGASIVDLVDDSVQQVRDGRATGGDVLTLRGSGFTGARSVLFGDVPATILDVSSPTRMQIMVPASTGDATVYLVDAYGRIARSSFVFEFVGPPTFGAQPYSPAFGALSGGTLVTMMGAGFKSTNRLLIDGVPTAFTWIDGTRIQFVSPAKSAGSYSAVVFDRFNESVVAPAFPVSAPPAVSAVTTVNSGLPGLTDISCYGGTYVRIDGSNFQSGLTVMVGGAQATVVSVTGSAVTIIAPAGNEGLADIVVTDVVGQAVTVPSALTFVP